MFKLVENEMLKLHARKNIYMFIGFLVFLEIVSVFAIRSWLPMKERFASYLSFTNMTFEMVTSLVTIFSIALATRIISEEFQKGTIKQLLIRPRKRITILFSKYLTTILTVIFVCLISLVVSMLIGFVFFGGEKEDLTIRMLLKIVTYKTLPILFYTTFAFFLANIFRKSVLPLIITLFIFFSQGLINTILFKTFKEVAQFSVFSHLNLEMYDSNVLISGGTKSLFTDFNFTTSLIFVIIHFAVLLIVSSTLFQKRDVL
ncbi:MULTISPECIES: ABC transporter permease [Bacillus cereus group]|uniref:ABC transporter permease n=1 Tax=Bacillus cereus group TaxID=86661 RepID=UPI0007AB80CB|nr:MULTISPECIES: ABC transporter permease [Bacillus cereus group]KAA0774821.1 ABC transporter permease [Bacillus sp. BB51/4]KZE05794.1 putative ABC transporter permease protein [Bacillus mycoides]QWH86587.1 ABC transporter permease [Bacillus mycoides]QWI98072.1 ABC transporter permease [Bacillus mycoides]